MKVVILNGEMAGAVFALRDGPNSLGRRANNDICIPLDTRVSRAHAELRPYEDEWVLEDIGSANGTFVEQMRIHAPTFVHPGDRFRLGRTWLTLQAEPSKVLDEASAPELVLVDSADNISPGEGEAQNIVFSMQAEREVPVSQADLVDLQGRIDALQRIGVALGATLDLNTLLGGIMDSIFNVIPAERGYLMLIDPQTKELVPRVARDRGGAPDIEQTTISRHIVEKALAERVVILCADAQSDERFQKVDSVQDLQIRSAICAPLVRRGESLGILFLDSTSRTHVFTQSDVELINGIATEAAVAIENARLYTDLRQAYEELQSAQDRLVRSEKLSTIGTLSATIAHDMANIVSPLYSLVDMVLAGTKLDAEGEELLRRQMRRLVALTERLMSFSRPKKVQLELTDIGELVQSIMTFVRTEFIHRRINAEAHVAEDLPKVMTDPLQMERVLLNLTLNAIEALEQKASAGDDGATFVINAKLDMDEIVIDVTDNGPGIPPDIQAQLFDPFFTTKENGTGLGLFTCRRILDEELGGSIEVDSVPERGATFTVRLPVHTPVTEITAEATPVP